MSEQQVAYRTVRFINNNRDWLYLASATAILGNSVSNFLHGDVLGLAFGAIWAAASIPCYYAGLKWLRERILLNEVEAEFERGLGRGEITDKNGLGILLERTRQAEKKEWGTWFKVSKEGNCFQISNILDPSEALRKGLVKTGTRGVVFGNCGLADELGYDDFHHFHTSGGAGNYSQHFRDQRLVEKVGLLSFNMPWGPELIAYTQSKVFLPTDSSKTSFVQAGPREISEYLELKR